MTDSYQSRPNLLLIGAQESGTTSVANALGAHRRVILPPEKELNFFSDPTWREGMDDYLNRFPDLKVGKYWMDATPGYMWTRTAYGKALGEGSPMQHDIAKAIFDTLGPNVRILAIMRHPIRRAVSAFFHHFRMGRLKTGDRIRDMGHRHGIIDLGFYSEHLAAYRALFPGDMIKAMFFEDYMRNTELVHRDIFFWLGLDPTETNKMVFDTNEGIKLDYTGSNISVRGGMEQVNALAIHPNYKKMKVIEPPVVEQADLDFMNDIYADELERMANEYEITNEIWPRHLTVETYSHNPSTSGDLELQLSSSRRMVAARDRQIRQIMQFHNEIQGMLQSAHKELETERTLIKTMEEEQKSRLSELAEMAQLLHNQESRHTEGIEQLERILAATRKEIAALSGA